MADDTKQTDFRFSEQFEPDVFWQQHGRKVTGGLLAVIVVGVVIFLWQQRVAQQAEEVAQRLATARDAASLEAILRDDPSKEVAGQTRLRLADLHYREGRYAEAAQHYRAFLEKFPGHALAPSAQIGLAAVEEAQGNLPAARQQYERLAVASADNYTVGLAKLGAARCAEAMGQLKEARQMYEELMALVQGTPLQGTAYLRWAVIGRELPAPAPPAATP